ncbi:hypothetical protein F383_37599 [Gossypium arboreum]|uniref:Uncharacterized protein n=1 Tax=Gossypium arboreum TaxID=29729 RepID=A0A0B0MCZ6_GOSAR|nr:hypothetical protein F383_37599 [Gossypium arboreum]
MFRSRTKEIRFGSGKNESCRLATSFRFTSSELHEHSAKVIFKNEDFGFKLQAQGSSAKSITLSTALVFK